MYQLKRGATERNVVRLSVIPIYMAFVYLGATAAPGVGIVGQAIASAPENLLQWSHAPIYGVFYWILARGLQQRGWPDLCAVTVAATTAFVFGIWMEIFQAAVPERTTSLEDLFHNGIGVGLAAISMWHLDTPQRMARREPIPSLQPDFLHQQG